MDKILILDGNNLAYSAYYALANMQYRGKSTSIIYGLPNMVMGYISAFKPNYVVVVWDGGRDKERLKLLPEYKQTRKQLTPEQKDSFYKEKDEAERLLTSLGIPQVRIKGMEADDLIYRHVNRAIKEGDRVIIISNDKDFTQLLRKRVKIFLPKSKEFVTHINCVKKWGVSPKQFVDYLSLVGDSSDNISHYPRIGPKKAIQILNMGIPNFLSKMPKSEKALFKSLLKRNRELISLKRHSKKLKNVPDYKTVWEKHHPIDIKTVKAMCMEYGITTFPRKSFLKHFIKLKKNETNKIQRV